MAHVLTGFSSLKQVTVSLVTETVLLSTCISSRIGLSLNHFPSGWVRIQKMIHLVVVQHVYRMAHALYPYLSSLSQFEFETSTS